MFSTIDFSCAPSVKWFVSGKNGFSWFSDSSTDLNKTQTPKSEVEPQNGAAAAKKEGKTNDSK